PHNESLFQKVNFLMQAAMGFINIEQNPFVLVITKHQSWHPLFPKNTKCKQTFLQNNSFLAMSINRP
ncbi:hypothetical protein CE195_07385, partial [Sodalis-like symbiont of Philaenus spumarius]